MAHWFSDPGSASEFTALVNQPGPVQGAPCLSMADIRIKDRSKDRYSALSDSPVWQLSRVREMKALVIGAGALGNEVCKHLAMMGTRLVAILDRDVVESANLSRSVFFREVDHGRPKTEVMAERLSEFNSDVEVLLLTGELDDILGLGLLRRMDLVFSCLDSRVARRSLNRMCEKVGTPWIDGAMENLLGTVSVYIPGKGACYECGLTPSDKAIIAGGTSCRGIALTNLSHGRVPTTSTMASIIAALQVQEGLKVLHGELTNALVGKQLVLNGIINDFYVTETNRNADCPAHDHLGEIMEVPEFTTDKTTARELLACFQRLTNQVGRLELGKEIITEVRCPHCDVHEFMGKPERFLTEDLLRCSSCGRTRLFDTTHAIDGTETYAELPLGALGIAALEILEVYSSGVASWFEMTGDLARFPASVADSPDARVSNIPASNTWASRLKS